MTGEKVVRFVSRLTNEAKLGEPCGRDRRLSAGKRLGVSRSAQRR